MNLINNKTRLQVSNVASNLLNLEISTILKSNITSRKMSSPAHTLIDIAKKFNAKLTILGWPCEGEEFAPGSFSSFEMIRENAKKGIKALEAQSHDGEKLSVEKEADLTMLWRIKTMSDQIKGIFNRLGETYKEKKFTRELVEAGKIKIELNSEDLVAIRKIWEIGTEVVALQTVIQIDGDVITRVNPACTGDKYPHLLELHDKSIGTSVNFWQDLVKMVTRLMGSLIDKIA